MMSPAEWDVLRIYTTIPAVLLNEIKTAIDKERTRRETIKRMKINLSSQQWNTIIACIAKKANKKECSDDIQYTLNTLFGRFAEKYNAHVYER